MIYHFDTQLAIMKILHIITSLRIGGAEKLVSEFAPRLQQKGHQVDVLLSDGVDSAFKKNLLANNIKIIEFSQGGNVYNPIHIFRLIPLLKKYDIVHTHNTAPQIFTALANVVCSVVIITTEHTTSNRRRDWRWYKSIDRWMYNRYHKIICISNAAEKNLREFLGNCNTHISTIYNGIDVRTFAEAIPEKSLKQQAGDKTILTMVAGFRYQKDQDTIIRAMKYLPYGKYELWLIGDGERRTILEQLCKEEQQSDNVRFLGIRNDIPEILKATDIVIMSSHFEGLSLSSIEGMASGKPFIASDVDGLHEITDGAGILFPHGDAKALAHVIEQLSKDDDLYQFTAQQCYQRAKEYDIQHTIDKYDSVYKSLMKSK